jgi:hypothetical protein
MAKFKAFKPQALERIAKTMGYTGDMGGFQQYLDSNVSLKERMKQLEDSAMEMSKNGTVKQTQKQSEDTVGAFVPPPTQTFDPVQMQQGGMLGALASGVIQGAAQTLGVPAEASQRKHTGITYDKNKLYQSSPTAGTQEYAANMPPEGYRFAFKGDGTRVTIPEADYMKQFGDSFKSTNRNTGARTRGVVNLPTYGVGTAQPLPQQFIPQAQYQEGQQIQDLMAKQAQAPALPMGGTIVPQGTLQETGQMVNPATGQLTGAIQTPIAQATTAQTQIPVTTQAAQITPTTTQQNVAQLQAQAQQTAPPVTTQAQTAGGTSVSNLNAAQGTAIEMQNPVQRQIQQGELISPAANAQTASQFTEQIESATATPTEQATVAGQLAQLTSNFDATNPPAWAAGALRGVQAIMQQRGMGASSIAGQAMVQAALESALPIASADAQTQAQFEAQNLSNRQQRAMLAAQQRATFLGIEFDQTFQSRVQNSARIGDIANMNFTAEQQVALENSRNANTVNLNNLSNRQAVVLAEASALANMDMANLSNRQQAAVMNAQNFMQVDMANLTNRQQTELFNAQARQQSMFTDQAAINASAQFNATSQNQVDQFFSQLQSQVGQFNASQANAQSQYNAGQVNTIERFNAELNNQREQFNAQNRLVIDQANAQWRRQIATADTLAINRANELNATALLGLSNTAYNNLWQHYGDVMEWAWTSSENNAERVLQMAMAELDAKVRTDLKNLDAEIGEGKALGGLVSDLFFKPIAGSLIGGIFG